MTDRKAVIKNADMSEEMQQDAVDCATQAMEKYNIEKDIAAFIKREFDKKYNPTWHCIVGRNFGSYHFIYFYLGQIAILLFKSGLSGLLLLFINDLLTQMEIPKGLISFSTAAIICITVPTILVSSFYIFPNKRKLPRDSVEVIKKRIQSSIISSIISTAIVRYTFNDVCYSII
ncbi:Dynein light chain 2, cytoplasmic [Globomyces sp. JEL0801]|nr:Dynein light chain 2, cytoplasmic [Globomyces sp. JEL0801]